jgi:hypothetical protein
MFEEIAVLNGMNIEQVKNMSAQDLKEYEFRDEDGNEVPATYLLKFFQNSQDQKEEKDFKTGSRENWDLAYRSKVISKREAQSDEMLRRTLMFSKRMLDLKNT